MSIGTGKVFEKDLTLIIKTKTNYQGAENFYNLEVSLNIQTEHPTVTILNGEKPNTSLDNEEDGKDAFYTTFPLSIILKILADTARQKKEIKRAQIGKGEIKLGSQMTCLLNKTETLKELITKIPCHPL